MGQASEGNLGHQLSFVRYQLKFQCYTFLSSLLRRKNRRPVLRTEKQRSITSTIWVSLKKVRSNKLVLCWPCWLYFTKRALEQNFSRENKFDLHENKPVSGKHFRMNGFACTQGCWLLSTHSYWASVRTCATPVIWIVFEENSRREITKSSVRLRFHSWFSGILESNFVIRATPSIVERLSWLPNNYSVTSVVRYIIN